MKEKKLQSVHTRLQFGKESYVETKTVLNSTLPQFETSACMNTCLKLNHAQYLDESIQTSNQI